MFCIVMRELQLFCTNFKYVICNNFFCKSQQSLEKEKEKYR